MTRLHLEPQRQDALFELPRKRWYLPAPDGPDLSVSFHGQRAGNPLGPAAGPHTQMAQNILLSYVAGGRILELKTVQDNDHLTIPRPCIDMQTVGYNIEWSQELPIEQTLREYVAGAMLIQMFRNHPDLGGGRLDGLAGARLLDLSVGYDLAGIRGPKVSRFLAAMCDAQPIIDTLRREIPREFAAARDYHYPARLATSVTLSTFHGCPADQIERICEYLLCEYDLDVIIKMNPPMLGQERLEHLLHDVLGYAELRVPPHAYDSGLHLDQAVQMCRRLTALANARGRHVGVKFCNTLEVANHRDVLPRHVPTMYLSGRPLHVLALTLAEEFRRHVGPDLPMSFSAGIDRTNVAHVVAGGFVPVSVCTDMLRPGGYGRMGWYLATLERALRDAGADTIDELILHHAGHPATNHLPDDPGDHPPHAVRRAAAENLTRAAAAARRDPRYRADHNRRVPQRIDSHLDLFDCITCEKCLPVCPNAANFIYPTPAVAFEYHDVLVAPDGTWKPGPSRRFEITRTSQIACFADFCNECGNCDTFCPEYGGPYIEKPSFFRTVQSWAQAAQHDGFVVGHDGFVLAERPEGGWIRGRLHGHEYQLSYVRQTRQFHFDDGSVVAVLTGWGHEVVEVRLQKTLTCEHLLDIGVYHTLRTLRAGVLDPRRVNQINVQWLLPTCPASGTRPDH